MSFNEARKIAQAISEFDHIIPVMVNDMGQIALNHFTNSFRDQGFTDDNFSPWKRRKNIDSRRGRGRKRYGADHRLADGTGVDLRRWEKTVDVRSVKNRAILVQTGTLRRSIRKQARGKYKVMIISNVPYANVHNEGLHSGRGSGFQMPKRQFVGYSAIMARKIENKIRMRIHSIFK